MLSIVHLLVLVRLLPLALAVRWIPRAIALSLALALTFALAPFAGAAPAWTQLPIAVLRELCVGGAFALAVSLALSAVPWSLRLAQPTGSRAPVATLATAYALCAAWLVLSLGGLRALVRALVASFRVLPLSGSALAGEAFALGVAKLVAAAMGAAIAIALPLAVASVVLELGAAMIWRASVGGSRESVLGPLAFILLAGFLLVPVVMRGPELLRIALEAALALTRSLAK